MKKKLRAINIKKEKKNERKTQEIRRHKKKSFWKNKK